MTRGSIQMIVLWIAVLAVDVIAAAGVSRLRFDDGLVRTFESDSRDYADYQAFLRAFPGNGGDIYLLAETDDFARPDALAAVEALVLDLQLTDGVAAVVSAFALPGAPLLPVATLDQADLAMHLEAQRRDRPALSGLLSTDRTAMLLLVQLGGNATGAVLDTIAGLGPALPAGVTLHQTGYPLVSDAVIDRLFGDFILLNVLGALAGTVVSALVLRSIALAGLTAAVSITALLWALGLMGFAGVAVNVVTVALPVLILMLSFSDALHLCFETRRQAAEGADRPAFRAIWRIGPACLIASVTTAIAFATLALSPSALVAELGRMGVGAALLAGVSVLVVHPLVYGTLWQTGAFGWLFARARGVPPRWTHLSLLPNTARRHPGVVTLATGAGLAAAAALYVTIVPNFSLYESVDRDDPLLQTIDRIEATFGPTALMHFIATPATGASASDVHTAMSDAVEPWTVFSAATLGADMAVADLPPALRDRLGDPNAEAVLLSVPFQYRDARTTRALAAELEAAAATVPNATLSAPQGLEVMTSSVSATVLSDMNRTLLTAVLISGLLIAIWLRDPLAGVVALVPNVLPIALVGAWLAWSGHGLEFTSGIALTVAFGLAIDDTVHVLNRLRLNHGGRIWADPDGSIASVRQVAPALVITSLVLTCGLAGTQFADLSSVGYFGLLAIAVFFLAVIADLLVLPALLVLIARARRTRVPA